MARVALWTFDEAPLAGTAVDSETSDGTAQSGSYENGATTTGAGAGVFDGVDDYVEVPNDAGFDLATGSIVITFTQASASLGDLPHGTNAAQTLFSHDSQGYDSGGHLTIYTKSDGSVEVRHQTDTESYYFEGGSVTLGQATTLVYTWGPTGSQLFVDGVLVDSGSAALTLVGDPQPITIGASQAVSGDGVADNLQGFFHGQIEGAAIHDTVFPAGSVPCFTRGALIMTPDGEVPIEQLHAGDFVTTLDGGAERIRWIGSRHVKLVGNAATLDKLRPVRIVAGALGQGLPKRDLLVSRQHRLMVVSKIAERMFGTRSVFSAAINLTALPGIYVYRSVAQVQYFHLLFAQHEVIFAEQAPAESLYAGKGALDAVSPAGQREIMILFPELGATGQEPAPALPIPEGRLQKRLLARHAKHAKPILEAYGFAAIETVASAAPSA